MTEPRGWTVRSSRMLHDDRWLRVRADHCVTAGGAELSPYYVLRYPDWANVVAVTPSAEVVMVRQYRHAAAAVVTELPGGMVDPTEDAAIAARRELAEETGYTVTTLISVGAWFANPATHTNRIHTFLGLDARRMGDASPEPGEEVAVQLLSIPAVLASLRDGRFGQSMQVGPLLLALLDAGLIDFGTGAAGVAARRPID